MKNWKMVIARNDKNLTQSELAEQIGVARQTIHLIEQGNYNPSIKLCIAICEALDVTLNDIFWNKNGGGD
jgi:putative transcriptional regulator